MNHCLDDSCQIAWAVFGFALVFFWTFVLNADLSFLTFRGPLGTVNGTITTVEKTDATEGGSNPRRGTPIFANRYQYSVAGTAFRGTSFTLGQKARAGDQVKVEYREKDPSDSRVAGMRRARFHPVVVVLTLLPLAAAIFLIHFTRAGLKRIRLLRHGMLANAVLKGKRPTNMGTKRGLIYELAFEFNSRDGRRHRTTIRSSISESLEDETQEPLLYDPRDPSQAWLLDDAPVRPQLTPEGQLAPIPHFRRRLILPLFVIIAHGITLVSKL